MASIFSRIVAGEIPSWKVAEDENYYAFLDINPLAEGHTLVIPKKEVDYIFDLDDETYAGLWQFAARVAKAVRAAVPCKRVGVAVPGYGSAARAYPSGPAPDRRGYGFPQGEKTAFPRALRRHRDRHFRGIQPMRPLSMKRLFFCLLALSLVVTACNQASTARISATIEGAPNTAIVLEKLNYNRLQTIDTIRTDGAGQFNYKVRLKGNEPYFYYLYREGSPIASLILLPSDQVTVVVPQEGRFTVEGSEESTLFQEVNEAYARASDQIRNLTASITDETPEAKVKEVNQQLSKLYVDYKRSAIRHMVTHPHSITSAVMAFQKFGDDLPVFGQESDFVILQAVRSS